MSKRYLGGVITANPATPTGPYQFGTAPGMWTTSQQLQYAAGGVWPVAGNTQPYIENVFSTYLYTGTSASQTITNGIDLAGKGGLTWIKNRNNTQSHYFIDSVRGISKLLNSNNSFGQGTDATNITSYNANGFTVQGVDVNASTYTYASWTFREQPKFFDIVTYTGDGIDNRQISHSLGSTPGCVIVKKLNGATNWSVYHRSSGAQGNFLVLNNTNAVDTRFPAFWGTTPFSSTTFSVSAFDELNSTGNQYIAYLFAHDAGGFGLNEDQNVINCGSFTMGGSGASVPPQTITLGFEPQWLLVKRTDSANVAYAEWRLVDNMRTWTASNSVELYPNNDSGDSGSSTQFSVTPTGFVANLPGNVNYPGAGATYIYIAIRRGPMAVPTLGTTVYGQQLNVSTPAFSFPPDMVLELSRASDPTYSHWLSDRLRGSNKILQTFNTVAEFSGAPYAEFNYGGLQNTWGSGWGSGYMVNGFRRAPGFFDVVCYSGNSTQTAYTHSLGVVPQMVIVKVRTAAGESSPVWSVSGTQLNTYACVMNGTSAYSNRGQNMWGTNPASAPSMTATTFRLGDNTNVNETGKTYVAYLFATCAGVSKVGSYTGTGTTQAIACGFTTGSRFVLIKRIDSASDWYVWDSARGITSGNDPYLLLNSVAAEVTGTDYINTSAAGFEITSTAPAEINASGGSYIFLAIS